MMQIPPVENMKRGKHHTSWAGALAVGAHLSRSSYDVTFTLGNTPNIDLLCCSPLGAAFKVQVKSLSQPNVVPIQLRLMCESPRHDLFFVVVLVPMEAERPLEFYVLTHAEVNALWQQMPKVKANGEAYKPGWEGLYWKLVSTNDCLNQWGKLPP